MVNVYKIQNNKTSDDVTKEMRRKKETDISVPRCDCGLNEHAKGVKMFGLDVGLDAT